MLHYHQVVIVDDDPDDRDIMQEAFNHHGFHNHYMLSSGQQLLDYLNHLEDKHLPQIIVTDLNMPDISGIDLLQTIRGSFRLMHIPVFIFSTSSLPEHIAKCKSLGAKDFITKPFYIDGYKAVVEKLKEALDPVSNPNRSYNSNYQNR